MVEIPHNTTTMSPDHLSNEMSTLTDWPGSSASFALLQDISTSAPADRATNIKIDEVVRKMADSTLNSSSNMMRAPSPPMHPAVDASGAIKRGDKDKTQDKSNGLPRKRRRFQFKEVRTGRFAKMTAYSRLYRNYAWACDLINRQPPLPVELSQPILLGVGAHSRVYSLQHSHQALKVSFDIFRLFVEYRIHEEIRKKMRYWGPRMSRALRHARHAYVPSLHCAFHRCEYLEGNRYMAVREDEAWPKKVLAAIHMNRVRGIHAGTREEILRRFIDPDLHTPELDEDPSTELIIRPYYGAEKPTPSQSQSPPTCLRDYPAYRPQLAAFFETTPKPDQGRCMFPQQMAQALAIIHWACHLDGAGIVFLLGRTPNRHHVLWVTSFGDVKGFDPSEETVQTQLVRAFTDNAPFYPRPGQVAGDMLWWNFKTTYCQTAKCIMRRTGQKGERKLVERFIAALEDHYGNHVASTPGPERGQELENSRGTDDVSGFGMDNEGCSV
jgi:hypothetical protein